MAASDPLLQPFTLRHLTLRNRVMSTAHAPAYVVDGMPRERYRLYHEEKARGGIALTIFGGSSNVAADSPSVFGQINIGADDVIPHFQALADGVHAHGAALMCQLTHMGRRTTWNAGDWLTTIAPSRVREPAHRSFPKEMDAEDINRVVKAFGQAARRCKEGGLDGLEILAHGHLVDQFWSPAVNKRTDGYGGPLGNRMRFSLEVLEEIRAQVGPGYIVGLRMATTEDFKGGLTLDAGLEIAQAHEATGMLDFLNLNHGHIETDYALARMMPGMAFPLAPWLEEVGSFRRELKLPVFHACRINDLATARYAVRENLIDMVAMTRAHMADPHIVRKLQAGAEETIRPCVGASYCIDRIYDGGEALCLHNPATGREAHIPHVIEKSPGPKRKVVVVGGGPAGLEAARVSAARGHHVVLFEATGQLGGQVVLAARAAWRADLIGIAQWLESEVNRLGVEVRFNILAGEDEVRNENPDVVVIATGGLPDIEWVEGSEHCVSVWDILSGSESVGDSVLVFDGNGQHQAPSCADFISAGGARVELVTPDRMAAAEMGGINYPIYLRNLYKQGVTLTPDHALVAVARAGNKLEARLRNLYSGIEAVRTVDQVVVEHGSLPLDGLFHDLKASAVNGGETDLDALVQNRPQNRVRNPAGAFQLFRVGDAVSSRNIHAAIYDSLRICKDL